MSLSKKNNPKNFFSNHSSQVTSEFVENFLLRPLENYQVVLGKLVKFNGNESLAKADQVLSGLISIIEENLRQTVDEKESKTFASSQHKPFG